MFQVYVWYQLSSETELPGAAFVALVSDITVLTFFTFEQEAQQLAASSVQ